MHKGLGLALGRLHVLQVGSNSLTNRGPFAGPDLLNDFDAGPVRLQLNGLAAGADQDFGAFFDLVRFLPQCHASMY